MKKVLLTTVLLTCVASFVFAADEQPQIKLRDLDLEGLLIKKGNLTLTAEFDVRKAKLMDELTFDFYLLLISGDNDIAPHFFHTKTIHRFIDEKSGHSTTVGLNAAALNALEPRDGKYAVVVKYRGEEVGVENSEKERWWEDSNLGKPIENILIRASTLPIVRKWETPPPPPKK